MGCKVWEHTNICMVFEGVNVYGYNEIVDVHESKGCDVYKNDCKLYECDWDGANIYVYVIWKSNPCYIGALQFKKHVLFVQLYVRSMV